VNESTVIYIVSFLVFVSVIALVEGIYLLYREYREGGTAKIHRRLRALSAAGVSSKEMVELLRHRQLSTNPVLNRLLTSIPRAHAIDRMLEQGGVELSIVKFVGLQLLLSGGLIALLVGQFDLHPLLGISVGCAVGFAIPYLYVSYRRRKRRERLADQLPDTLDFIARSLRAGNPFSASMKAVANEMPDPVAMEFGTTFDETNYGLDLDDALHNLGERAGSEEVHYFITAVLIQRTTGGNLASVLNKLATVLRSRARTYREINIQAGEMRTSARILIALPFVVAGAVSIFNPGYLSVFVEDPVGRIVAVVQIILMVIGYLVMRRMIRFRV
jgi:tight adherence protein B